MLNLIFSVLVLVILCDAKLLRRNERYIDCISSLNELATQNPLALKL